MKTVMATLVVLWLLVGAVAAFQRGDFEDGNCSSVADTAAIVALGPFNYAAPETLLETCSQPTRQA
ncbi:hypothetical protein N798_09565 [Knoellia flava TL1]|uniref:Uncharacterized protein n=2 Tax=Knoellia flava TaxID=913969 RepID=A0A8H9KR15_9MICO|nr:hypothetical protein [Knoellia flava]KGN31092.1 hypothetical protein N798_09565 [Knoellia flava TL1]GGB82891.1 hypothetical protein GCM10011314_23140 [Knoellia flava]